MLVLTENNSVTVLTVAKKINFWKLYRKKHVLQDLCKCTTIIVGVCWFDFSTCVELKSNTFNVTIYFFCHIDKLQSTAILSAHFRKKKWWNLQRKFDWFTTNLYSSNKILKFDLLTLKTVFSQSNFNIIFCLKYKQILNHEILKTCNASLWLLQ